MDREVITTIIEPFVLGQFPKFSNYFSFSFRIPPEIYLFRSKFASGLFRAACLIVQKKNNWTFVELPNLVVREHLCLTCPLILSNRIKDIPFGDSYGRTETVQDNLTFWRKEMGLCQSNQWLTKNISRAPSPAAPDWSRAFLAPD